MADIIITILIIGILAGMIFCSIKFDKKAVFMDKSYTTALKGIACIVVVLVHIPVIYSNRLQDLIGSFAYIGVTLFFLISAYGCRASLEQNRNYLNMFWRKRLVALFIPAIILSILNFIINKLLIRTITLVTLFSFNRYIYAIIVAYFIFWIVYRTNFIFPKYKDMFICFGIMIASLLTKLTSIELFFDWPTESIGFIWGVIVFNNRNLIEKYLKENQIILIVALALLSFGIGGLYIKVKPVFFYGDYLVKIFLGLVLISLIFTLSINTLFLKDKILSKLGNISYEVFLSHFYVINYLEKFLINTSSGIFIGLVLVLTIIIAIIVKTFADFINKSIKRNLLKST